MRLFRLPLPVPRRTLYERIGVGPDASADEVRSAQTDYVRRLEARGGDEDEIKEANAVNLANKEERGAYDAQHPPIAILRLEPVWYAVFEDRAEGLAVLRRDLERFLGMLGAPVSPPSDLTRADFSDDFAHASLLDGEEPA